MKIEIDEAVQCDVTAQTLKEDYVNILQYSGEEERKLQKAFKKVLKYYLTEPDYKEFMKTI